ncbi:adenylate kinase [Meredithblackwellia eburnea MCA 4105]
MHVVLRGCPTGVGLLERRTFTSAASSLNTAIKGRGLATSVEPMSKKLHMIILGAPGAGKGTQSERLLKRWDIQTVVVGDLLRKEIGRGTPLGKQADEVIKAGALLPDDIVLKLIEPELSALRDKNWILDGFPRKASQAKLLDETLTATGGGGLNLVVNLAVPDEVILERIEERWVHPQSGRIYNKSFNPPKVAGKDDITGEPLIRRSDDTPEIFAKRLASFHAENTPILSHYAKAQVELETGKVPTLVTLAGRTSDEIFPKLAKVVEERFPQLPSRT